MFQIMSTVAHSKDGNYLIIHCLSAGNWLDFQEVCMRWSRDSASSLYYMMLY